MRISATRFCEGGCIAALAALALQIDALRGAAAESAPVSIHHQAWLRHRDQPTQPPSLKAAGAAWAAPVGFRLSCPTGLMPTTTSR